MKLLVDASALALDNSIKAGVWRYGIELLRHLPAALPKDWSLRLWFNYFSSRHRERTLHVVEQAGKLDHSVCRIHPKLLQWLRVPAETVAGPHDVLHSPFDRVRWTHNAARVVTIHDLAFLRAPKGLPKKWVEELRATVPASAKRAHCILTGSEFTKTDIVEWLHIPAERVAVIHHGVLSKMKPPADPLLDRKRLEERYGLRADEKFILCLGTLQPNKNIERLCAAFQEMRAGGWEGRLVLAGKEGWLFEKMWKNIVDHRHDEGVLRTGFVDDEDVPRLYGNCACAVLVSVLEGFGIPVLEAMACGAPVVIADACSLPEVAGGAAMIVDAWDPRSIAAGIEQAASNGPERKQRIQLGLQRARGFTWQKSAEAHVRAYQQALAESRS